MAIFMPSRRERATAVCAVMRKLGPGLMTARSCTKPIVASVSRLADMDVPPSWCGLHHITPLRFSNRRRLAEETHGLHRAEDERIRRDHMADRTSGRSERAATSRGKLLREIIPGIEADRRRG